MYAVNHKIHLSQNSFYLITHSLAHAAKANNKMIIFVDTNY